MTNIIAILMLAGSFQVAMEGPSGYLVETYPDTEQGVEKFFQDSHKHLKDVKGRFFPCVVYQMPPQDLLKGKLIYVIGPGTGYAASLVNGQMVEKYRANGGAGELDSKMAEKVCVANFPADYRSRFPESAGVAQIQSGRPIKW